MRDQIIITWLHGRRREQREHEANIGRLTSAHSGALDFYFIALTIQLLRNLFIELIVSFLLQPTMVVGVEVEARKKLTAKKKGEKKRLRNFREDSRAEPGGNLRFVFTHSSNMASLINSIRRKAFFLSARVERIVNNQSTNREKCFFFLFRHQVNKILFSTFASSNSPRTVELNNPINYLFCLFHIARRFIIFFLRQDVKNSRNCFALFSRLTFLTWKSFSLHLFALVFSIFDIFWVLLTILHYFN